MDRVATILADPTVDRLKPRFVDVVLEYCRLCVRLRALYAAFPTLDEETYEVETRNGHAAEDRPARRSAQRDLAAMALARRRARAWPGRPSGSMLPGQGDLFDDAERFFAK